MRAFFSITLKNVYTPISFLCEFYILQVDIVNQKTKKGRKADITMIVASVALIGCAALMLVIIGSTTQTELTTLRRLRGGGMKFTYPFWFRT